MGLLSLMCLGLFGLRVLVTGSTRYVFIPGNLVLAWVGLFMMVILVRRLKASRWQSWQNIFFALAWLVFLPNAWYVLTDFIHVYPNGEISQLYDIVLMSSLVFCGFSLGLASLYLFHRELVKRVSRLKGAMMVELVVLLSSFAVYLGRDLRWNTWDVITDPGSLILNVSGRIVDPLGSPRALDVTLLFFILVSCLYWAVWTMFRPNQSHSS